jgi:hypothetical protein
MENEHGLRHVDFSELNIDSDYSLFKIVDRIKALKFFFADSEYTKKPEKFTL